MANVIAHNQDPYLLECVRVVRKVRGEIWWHNMKEVSKAEINAKLGKNIK